MSFDELSMKLAKVSDDRLQARHRVIGRRIRWCLEAMLICVALGIWIDWRWLPTALLILVFALFNGWLASLLWAEIERRASRKRGQVTRKDDD